LTRLVGAFSLGARPGNIRGLVLREAGTVATVGTGLGLAGAVAVSRAARGMFYGLDGTSQPAIVAGVAVVLGVMATIAALGPARRATRVDPLEAMRGD
jgi:ABC-type antimicrobial peptide transport system permease subunit